MTYVRHVWHVLLHRSQHRHFELGIVHVLAVHKVGARGSPHLDLIIAHFVLVHHQVPGLTVVHVVFGPSLGVDEVV